MAKKVIHTIDELGALRCDNPKCDHVDPNQPFGKHLIGKPCPKCRANLLTERDYKIAARIVMMVNLVNFCLGWLFGTEEPPKTTQRTRVDVRHGTAKVEKVDD